MRARRAARTVGAVALVMPMAAALVTGGTPAHAAGGTWLSPTPAPETVFSSGSSVTVKGQINEGTSSQATLKLNAPGGSYDPSISWSCPSNWDGSALRSTPCARSLSLSFTDEGSPRPNGRWTASLSDGGLSRSFYTNFAPSTPSGLSAKGIGAGQVDLSWSYGGAEPDLVGFVISDDKGNSFTVDDPSARSYTATYTPNPTPGTYDYSFTVRARRSSCGSVCGSSTVAGDSSSPASAQLVTPQPPPSPTPSPSTGGTTGGTTAGTTGTTTGGGATGGSTGATGTAGTTSGGATSGTAPGGSAGGATTGQPGATTGKAKPVFTIPTLSPHVAQRRAFALGFNSFSPSLGIPKLPPLPATKFPVTAPDQGTYQPTLPYQPQKEVTATDVFTDPVGAITNLDSGQLAKSIAVALILMLSAAHVRRFLGDHTAA